jgi:hypothetical protein
MEPCYVVNAKIDEVLQLLGVKKLDNGSHWQVEFNYNPKNTVASFEALVFGCGVTILKSGKSERLCFKVFKPANPYRHMIASRSDAVWDKAVREITVDSKRPAADIVREFTRRIDWEACNQYLEVLAVEIQEFKESIVRHNELVQKLNGFVGGKVITTDEPFVTYIRPPKGSKFYCLDREPIRVGHLSVSFEVRGVEDQDLACRLCAAFAAPVLV